MRRTDLEVTEAARIDEIIAGCTYMNLAFADGTRPYVLPLSFGYRREEGKPVFYFHSAAEGRKVKLARTLAYAGFTLSRNQEVKPHEKACDFSMRYECVIGEGAITELLDPTQKAEALNCIMQQFSGKADWTFPETVLSKTLLFRLEVAELSGREHK